MAIETSVVVHISAALRELIQAAVVAHVVAHDGSYLRCRDRECEELRIDLMGLIEIERDVDRLREALA